MEPLEAVRHPRVYHKVGIWIYSGQRKPSNSPSQKTAKNPRSNLLSLCFLQLIPNVVRYENLTTTGGEHIELPAAVGAFLAERGHALSPVGVAAVCQLVVQDLRNPVYGRQGKNRRWGEGEGSPVFHGLLTAVSDPRKGGWPAGQ